MQHELSQVLQQLVLRHSLHVISSFAASIITSSAHTCKARATNAAANTEAPHDAGLRVACLIVVSVLVLDCPLRLRWEPETARSMLCDRERKIFCEDTHLCTGCNTCMWVSLIVLKHGHANKMILSLNPISRRLTAPTRAGERTPSLSRPHHIDIQMHTSTPESRAGERCERVQNLSIS